jgi:anti-sigma B factor antagonist
MNTIGRIALTLPYNRHLGDSELSSQPLFSVRTESRNDVCRICLQGEMDMAAVPILEDELANLNPNPSNLLIDLSALKFVDSSGLKYLIDIHQRLGSPESTIELIHPSDPVMKLIELTGTQFLVTPPSESRLLPRFAGSG